MGDVLAGEPVAVLAEPLVGAPDEVYIECLEVRSEVCWQPQPPQWQLHDQQLYYL